MTAIRQLSEFVSRASLDACPSEARSLVRTAILDVLGVMLAGADEAGPRIVRHLAREEAAAARCTVVGTQMKTSPMWAALANGTAGHALDFDDTAFSYIGHPSAPLVSALLAAGELAGADGSTIMLGYIVGFEVAAALGLAVNPAHYQRGWHATSTLGTIGCAAATARVLRLDREQTRHALGLAASFASGVKANFGSMTKPYHAGHAAQAGLRATLLAREGFAASEHALDGPQGYLEATGTPSPQGLAPALAALGTTWQLAVSGISFKPYPSCALTHAAIDTLVELRRQHTLAADEIERVDVGVHPTAPGVLLHPAPSNALERKFSMQFCAATALVDGHVGIEAFADGPIENTAVRDLMSRIAMSVDPQIPDGKEQQAWCHITIRKKDGSIIEAAPRGARGHKDRPLPAEVLETKFFDCAGRVVSREVAEHIARHVRSLDTLADIRALTALLSGPVS